MYILKFHKSVKKFIESKDEKTRKRFKEVFIELSKNPYPNNINIDVKKYRGNIPNKFRLRIGKYRFLYVVVKEEHLIIIEKGDTRGHIY